MSEETPQPASGDPVRETSPMVRVGEALSRARAARGLSVEDVAAQLKFAPRQVSALEQGQPDGVPNGAFARGMIRSYCRLLKIDPEPLLAAMPVALPDADRLTERFSQPVPFSDSTRKWNVAYASLAVLALAVAGWFAYEWQSTEASAPAAPAVASRAPEPAQPTVSTVAAPTAEVAPPVAAESAAPSSSGTSVPAAGSAAPPPSAQLPSQAAMQPTPPVTTVAPPQTAQLPDKPPPGMRRLVLRFQREAWVEVRDGAGRMVFSQLNPAGSERVLDSPVPMSLVIGNAQHVRLSLDGAPVDLQPYIKVEVARLTLP